ncbi:hypothetical protein Sjap_009211 [Stephania japonica]|uniref:Uncharacterized protein n=1 Tax=Stephania japonica TaxID=461633 RepID=A0AAP0JTE2_9MAGN
MHLKLLYIANCTLLQCDGIFFTENNNELPLLSCLELVVRGCHALNSLNFPLQCWSSLRDVQIVDCRGLKSFPEGLSLLPHLEVLRIGQFCEDLDNFPFPDSDQLQIHYFTCLKYLALVGWPKLKSLPHQLQHLKKLKALLIEEFSGLITLPDWLGGLVLLHLLVYSCENLTHLPSKEAMLRLTLLEEFDIKNCPLLKDKCNKDRGGHEWSKISHIQTITIDDVPV